MGRSAISYTACSTSIACVARAWGRPPELLLPVGNADLQRGLDGAQDACRQARTGA